MKMIVAIVGDAYIEGDKKKQALAFDIGKLLIENSYVLATGGLGGVMEYASKGAKTAKNYTEGSIIGVLPSYNSQNANPYLDIAIPSGLGLSRNLLLVSMASAVIAVGGGAGTLSEISFAWQMKKLVISLKTSGWSSKLAGQSLDDRRSDKILAAESAKEALELLNHNIANYRNNTFEGVKMVRIEESRAKEIITSQYDVNGPLRHLGKGSEGFVLKDDRYIYKLIDTNPNPLGLYWQLSALASKISKFAPIDCIWNFETPVIYESKYVLIRNSYVESSGFLSSPNIPIERYVQMLKGFKRIGWVCIDINPQNLRVLRDGALMLSDVGHSLYPFSMLLFQSMCRRAFVIHKLQTKIDNVLGFKPYLTTVNKSADFSKMAEFGFNEQDINREFERFYQRIITTTKNEVLNPALKSIFDRDISVETVLDYGSGHGDHSQMLAEMGIKVTAYEPDVQAVAKHKEQHYDKVRCINYNELKKMTSNNVTFDAVLCSLVLCYWLADSEQERLAEIDKIMGDLATLSSKYVVIAICNPFYNQQPNSPIQKRTLPNDFDYYKQTPFNKNIFSTGRDMTDIHRPVSFYEELFRKSQLKVKQIVQTMDTTQVDSIANADFVIFVLSKTKS